MIFFGWMIFESIQLQSVMFSKSTVGCPLGGRLRCLAPWPTFAAIPYLPRSLQGKQWCIHFRTLRALKFMVVSPFLFRWQFLPTCCMWKCHCMPYQWYSTPNPITRRVQAGSRSFVKKVIITWGNHLPKTCLSLFIHACRMLPMEGNLLPFSSILWRRSWRREAPFPPSQSEEKREMRQEGIRCLEVMAS